MALENLPDERLIQNVRSGDRSSFRVLYERYRLKIFRFLYHLLGERACAEDCTQDVFLRVHERAIQYREGSSFSSWLYGIARHAALDAMRRGKVRRAVSLDEPRSPDGEDAGAALKELIASGGPGPDAQAESKELVELLRRAVLSLDPDDRQLVVLCDIEGMPHKQVSEITGLEPGNVAVKLHRARKKLAERLKL